MNPHQRSKLTMLAFAAAAVIFACSLVGSAEPTLEPPTSVPPTQAPSPTLEPTLAPTETQADPTEAPSTGADIVIDQVNGYVDVYDTLNIVGLVTNNTERAIDNVEVEVEVFDANGASLFLDTIYVDLFSLAPGETSPFSLIIFEDLPGADTFEARIVGNSVTELDRAPLDVDNTLMTFDDDGNIHITGELFNNNNQPVDISSLAAAVFDANGGLITADSYDVTIRYLDPGQSGPFRVTLDGPQSGLDEVADFQLYLDVEFTEPIEPFDISISDAFDYLDAFDSFHLVGEITNNDPRTLSIYLVAGIYDAEGNVLDAASIGLPIDALATGERAPYDLDTWSALNRTSELLDQADTYTIQVDAYWTWETTTVLYDLATANDSFEFDDFGGTFTGQVVNNSGGAIGSAVVVIHLVDKESGLIVATDYTYLFDEIPDGGTLDYTIFLDPEAGFDPNSVDYFITVKGERP